MTNKYHIFFRMQQFKQLVYEKCAADINLYFYDKGWPKYEPIRLHGTGLPLDGFS
jgi:hypothetical protein